MSNLKRFGVLIVVTAALGAIPAASASATKFTASATGTLVGHANSPQVFSFNAGPVSCSSAATNTTINGTSTNSMGVSVNYSGCTAFGSVPANVSTAEYEFTASFSGSNAGDNTFAIKKQINIVVPTLFCEVHVTNGQSVKAVSFTNNSTHIVEQSKIASIKYNANGGACSSNGSNGTYNGDNDYERSGGGSVNYDP